MNLHSQEAVRNALGAAVFSASDDSWCCQIVDLLREKAVGVVDWRENQKLNRVGEIKNFGSCQL